MKNIKSAIFGDTILLESSELEFQELEIEIDKYPANAFGILNKKLNKLGFNLTLSIFKETEQDA